MKKVSIILLANEDYLKNRFCYETFISKIDAIDVEVLVASFYKDNKTLEFFNQSQVDENSESTSKKCDYFTTKFQIRKDAESETLNHHLKKATGEYICILKPTILLDEHWLSDLIHFYETIDKSGIISISDGFENLTYLPLMSEGDKFVNVMQPEVSWIKDVCFFKREFLNHVGCFDEEIKDYDNALKQLCLRFAALGYDNYYIPSQTCIKVNSANGIDVNQDKKEQKYIVDSLFEMKQRKSYYLLLK